MKIAVALLLSLLAACSSESKKESVEKAHKNIDVKLGSGIWSLVELGDSKQGWDDVLEDTGYTLVFTESEMSVIGTIDCNSFSTHYDYNKNNLSIQKVAPTRMACPFLQNSDDDQREGYYKQRKLVFNALQGILNYQIEGLELTLTNSNGLKLRYRLDGK